MFHRRYRSHHDAEFALKNFLKISRPEPLSEVQMLKTLNSFPEKDNRVIYFHVPYCDRLCSFCNLNRKFCGGSTEERNKTLEKYTDYLIQEIDKYSGYEYIKSKPFKSIYFGGGTPTIFSTEQLGRILKEINDKIPMAKDCEFTFESTLHNLNEEKVNMMKNFGVNRFSIGIQTFNTSGRRMLSRSFTYLETVKRLKVLRNQFDGTLCIDIIYSYPGQSIENIFNDSNTIVSCGVDSVSFYSLMLHEESFLSKQIDNGSVLFDRTLESDKKYHNSFYNSLIKKGFTLLELSKLVKPGKDEYRYIKLKYLNADVLPLGIGAAGRLENISIYRMSPTRNFYGFVNPKFDFFHEMLGRMQYGTYDLDYYSRILNEKEFKAFLKTFNLLNEKKFFEKKSHNYYTLNTDGVFWGNNIAIEFMKSIIESEDLNYHQNSVDFEKKSH